MIRRFPLRMSCSGILDGAGWGILCVALAFSNPMAGRSEEDTGVSSRSGDARVEAAGARSETEVVPRPWEHTFTLRSWAGYRNNPRLSSVRPVGSAFAATGGEYALFRLPIGGWEAMAFAVVEHLEYVEDELRPETTGILDGRVKREWESGWWAGLGVGYFYLRQVFDASEIVGVPIVIRTEGHTLGVRPVVGKALHDRWKLELEPEWSRQWLREPLDGFDDEGARIQGTWTPSRSTEMIASYRFRHRGFESRPTRDAEGFETEGVLAYRQHEWEAAWRAHWGAARAWRSTLRAGYLRSEDNGGGFFDFDRYQLGGQIRWQGKIVEIRAEGRGRWYSYPVQRANFTEGPRRHRIGWTAESRADWKFGKGWRLFASGEADVSDENIANADYVSWGVQGGIEVEW